MSSDTIIAHSLNSAAKLRLFCFPYAGSDGHIYNKWRHELSSVVDVIPIHLPGRGARLNIDPYTCINAVTTDVCSAIAPLLDRDYAVFGYSMGAILAYEVIHYLRQMQCVSPKAFFAAACAAPKLMDARVKVSHLSDKGLVQYFAKLGGIPREALENQELMSLVVPALRSDAKVMESFNYVERPYLDVPIHVYGGSNDQGVTADDQYLWREETKAPIVRKEFPGGHFFLQKQHQALTSEVREQLQILLGT